MTTYYIHSKQPLTPATRAKLQKLHAKLQRHLRNVLAVNWVLARDAGDWSVSCRVQGQSGTYRASVSDKSVLTALDQVEERLLRQRRRVRRKRIAQRHRRTPEKTA